MTQLAEKLHRLGRAKDVRPAARAGFRTCANAARRASTSLGFPTVRDEEWRYTNVAPIAAGEFRPASTPQLARRPSTALALRGRHGAAAGLRQRPVRAGALALDRRCRAECAPVRWLRPSTAISRPTARWSSAISVSSPTSADRAFAALNTAFFEDGAFVHVPRRRRARGADAAALRLGAGRAGGRAIRAR